MLTFAAKFKIHININYKKTIYYYAKKFIR